MKINELAKEAHEIAVANGFWRSEERILNKMKEQGFLDEEIDTVNRAFESQKIMLIVTELSEFIEAHRKGD